MTDKIEDLSKEVEDKESQLKRERERVEGLLRQLDEQNDGQKSFELLQAKTASILDRLDEHYSRQAGDVKAAQAASQAK